VFAVPFLHKEMLVQSPTPGTFHNDAISDNFRNGRLKFGTQFVPTRISTAVFVSPLSTLAAAALTARSRESMEGKRASSLPAVSCTHNFA
jgi:hypothetical protein